MATLVKIKNAIINTITGAPGKSMKVDTEGLGKSVDDGELYHLPGIFSRPQDDLQGVNLDVNGLNIIIATHDYKINKSLDKGEIIVYSVDASGTIKGDIFIDKTGKIAIRNETKSLKTLIDTLIDEVKAIITTGSPTSQTVSPGSQSLLDAVKTEIADLLRD